MIRAVLFDFAGVVTNAGFQDWLSEHIAPYSTIKSEMMPIQDKVDRGDLPPSFYYEYLSKKTNLSQEEIKEGILHNYYLNNDTIAIIDKLHKKGIRLGLFSNFPKEWFVYVREKFQLNSIFDEIVVSSLIHLIKPEAKAFQYILNKLNTHADQAVFVDDRKENVEGAEKVGMHGIVFTSAEQLQEDLKKLGLPL